MWSLHACYHVQGFLFILKLGCQCYRYKNIKTKVIVFFACFTRCRSDCCVFLGFHPAYQVCGSNICLVQAQSPNPLKHFCESRYELEQQLLAGDISIQEVPRLWNEKMTEYLGCTPKDDAQGVLQDVHWSAGIMGYFPTYSLGAMYACQIYQVRP